MRPLNAKLDELDLQEKIEKQVIDQFKQKQSELRIKIRNEKHQQEEKTRQEECDKKQREAIEKERMLQVKRNHLMKMLKVEMHKVSFIQ